MSYISTVAPAASVSASTDISGQPVTVSGNVVNVSISGNIVNISGQGNFSPVTTIEAPSWLTVTGGSGGVPLTTQSTRSVTVQNLPTSSGNIHVGGSNANDYPTATRGLVLVPGAAVTFYVDNMDRVSVYATVSGDKVAMIGETP